MQLSQLHQQSSVAFICSVGALIARLVYLKGVHLSQVHQPSSMAFICLVGVLIAWLVYFLLGWCTYSLVGALETSAPPEATSAQIHRLRSPPDQIPSAVQSDSVRRPIRFRPPSDQIPFAVRSDSVRCPTTWCEEVNREDCAAIHSGFTPCILLCSQN